MFMTTKPFIQGYLGLDLDPKLHGLLLENKRWHCTMSETSSSPSSWTFSAFHNVIIAQKRVSEIIKPLLHVNSMKEESPPLRVLNAVNRTSYS